MDKNKKLLIVGYIVLFFTFLLPSYTIREFNPLKNEVVIVGTLFGYQNYYYYFYFFILLRQTFLQFKQKKRAITHFVFFIVLVLFVSLIEFVLFYVNPYVNPHSQMNIGRGINFLAMIFIFIVLWKIIDRKKIN